MQDLILSLSGPESDVQKTGDPLTFWKEIAHAGEFKKGSQDIKITPRLLDHWKRTFGEMRAVGMSVPVPVEHTSDPEKRRGEVVKLARRDNSRGEPALYAKIRFRDEEAAKLRHSGVSVWSPKRGESGYGQVWTSPLTHVAITDYPVIPDLEPFTQAIALSFGGPPDATKPAEKTADPAKPADGKGGITVRSIADMLGVDPAVTDETQLLTMIAQMVQQMRGAQQQRPPMPPMPQMPMRPAMPMQAPMRPSMAMAFENISEKKLMSMSKKQFKKLVKSVKLSQQRSQRESFVTQDEDDFELPESGSNAAIQLSGTVLQAVRDGRQAQIEGLHKAGFVTAAARKELEARFVKSQTVALSHQYDDGFESTVRIISANGRVVNVGKSGPQVGALALSKNSDGDTTANPLVADAERLAKGEKNF